MTSSTPLSTPGESAGLDTNGQRTLTGVARVLVMAVSIVLPTLTIVVAFTGWFDTLTRRAGHLLLAIPIVFLLYPARRSAHEGRSPGVVDWLLALSGVVSFGWIVIERERLLWRLVYVDPLTWMDMTLGLLAILLVLEAARRTLGWTLVAVSGGFIVYAFAGPYVPGILQHKGVSTALLVEHLYLVPEGIFNQITGIMATYLLVFLTFGTFLRMAGGDELFMDLAAALGGRAAGGPAKVAIMGSTFMGMVSGSTIANVVTTGTVTIPLMKRAGYSSQEAAAIETAAGTGGAVTPPLMGAGVFIMAESTGIPLITILKYSALPAFLYFASLYAHVHVKAKKRNMVPLRLDDSPGVLRTLVKAWPLLVSLGLIIYLLACNYSPFYSSALSVIALVLLSQARRETRLTPRRILAALEATTRGALVLSATSATAALMLGVITITGLMLKMTTAMVTVAGDSLMVGIIMVAATSTIVGMCLPITSTYIIVATLGAMALVKLGTSMLAAHLIIFWFAQTATITPPVCMTAFVAAAIAGAPPIRTGFETMWVAKALYLVPLMFVYTSILSPVWWVVVVDAGAALLGFMLIPSVTEGYYRGRLGGIGRAVVGAASVCFFAASLRVELASTVSWLAAGLCLIGGLSLAQRRRFSTSAEASIPSGGLSRDAQG